MYSFLSFIIYSLGLSRVYCVSSSSPLNLSVLPFVLSLYLLPHTILYRITITSRIMDINMNSSQIVGDIDMETIDPKKSNVMVECNREREDIGSSKSFKGIEEINEKKATYTK